MLLQDINVVLQYTKFALARRVLGTEIHSRLEENERFINSD